MRTFKTVIAGIALVFIALLLIPAQTEGVSEEVVVKEIDLTTEELLYLYGKLKREYSGLEQFIKKQVQADEDYAEVGTMLSNGDAVQRQTDLRAMIIQKRVSMTTPQKVRDYFDSLDSPEA